MEKRRYRGPAVRRIAALVLIGCGITGGRWYLAQSRDLKVAAVVSDEPDDAPHAVPTTPPPTASTTTHPVTLEEKIGSFCRACHLFPPPDILARDRWAVEVKTMYKLAEVTGEVPGLPSLESVVDYFQSRAPEQIPLPPSYAHLGPGPVQFAVRGYRPPDLPPSPAVSYLKLIRGYPDGRQDLLICDMRHGLILLHRLGAPTKRFITLARVPNPAHLEVTDLDRDGIDDLIVANLGSFLPDDHDRGSVVWLRGRRGRPLEPVTLLENVGRVADVQVADLDADGDLDLVVAVFGWRKTGQVLILENQGTFDDRGAPRFARWVLDQRSGAIHVPVVDLDGDGKLDIVVLLAQQYETVVAYLHPEPGPEPPEPEVLFEAPHPDWGSSGIEVVDLDGDGDLDIVMANGDTLDSFTIQSFQGIYWLENQATFPFRAHRLATLPGAHKVRAVDLDRDGDLDLVASSFLPQVYFADGQVPDDMESVIWLEQVSPGVFRRHSLEAKWCNHPAFEVGDFDRDGDVDLVIGNYTMKPEKAPIEDWITVFENIKAL